MKEAESINNNVNPEEEKNESELKNEMKQDPSFRQRDNLHAEEDEDVFGSLSTFAADVLNNLSTPVEPLPLVERLPRPLSPQQHDISQCLRLFQDLITYDGEEFDVSYGPETLDFEGKLAATSHLLAAIVTTLEPQHLRRLATRLISDLSLWVSRLFRYFDATIFLNDDAREGIIRVSRMLLHVKYPKYALEGYEALFARPPVIYTTTAIRAGLSQHITSSLGLSNSCLRIVPCNTVVGSPVAMDTAALDRMMTEDANAQRKPLLVIANAGGGLMGGVDNVCRIQELCLKHECWLHVEGHSLAALALPNAPNLPAKVGDSMTLPLSTWLGVPSLPYVTLYRAIDTTAVHAAGLVSLLLQVRLDTLPLWMTFQVLGQTGITSRLQHAFELSLHLQRHLLTMDHIRLMSPTPCANEGHPSIEDLISKPISTSQLLETACSTVVFQYVKDKKSQEKNTDYYDSLNSWLGQVVRRDVGSIPLELVNLDSTGLVLRWIALEGPQTPQVNSQHIDLLVHSLRNQIDILNATVSQREKFIEQVTASKNMVLAELPMWAGLGGVRYVSDLHAEQENLSENAKLEINGLNEHLVNQLRNSDSAFSLGEGVDGMNCVRFGMVTTDTDITELLAMVVSIGKEIESSSKFLSQMTEVVKKGIETATADLQRESEERLWQEGLLRHVPIVGSVYNWFSPPAPPAVKGRTLDLTAGVLESTENIYRYHMQLRHGQTTRSDTKRPPAPSVVTPMTPTSSTPTHSRASSSTIQELPSKTFKDQVDISTPESSLVKNTRTIPNVPKFVPSPVGESDHLVNGGENRSIT